MNEFAACTPHSGVTTEEFRAGLLRVSTELWDGDPAATFAEARRLFAAGADRHDIMHTLAERKMILHRRAADESGAGPAFYRSTGRPPDAGRRMRRDG